MASRLDEQHARDFAGMVEVKDTVIRRIGGRDDRTEEVTGIVEFDDESGGLTTDENGKMIQISARLEVAADQDTTRYDTWVIDGEVYQQIGEPTGKDGGSQTIVLTKRKGVFAKRPRVQ